MSKLAAGVWTLGGCFLGAAAAINEENRGMNISMAAMYFAFAAMYARKSKTVNSEKADTTSQTQNTPPTP